MGDCRSIRVGYNQAEPPQIELQFPVLCEIWGLINRFWRNELGLLWRKSKKKERGGFGREGKREKEDDAVILIFLNLILFNLCNIKLFREVNLIDYPRAFLIMAPLLGIFRWLYYWIRKIFDKLIEYLSKFSLFSSSTILIIAFIVQCGNCFELNFHKVENYWERFILVKI